MRFYGKLGPELAILSLMPTSLDDVDLHLLRLLQADGRISNADLARTVGLSPPSVHQRIRKLQGLGLIRSFAAILDSGKMGFALTVFAQVSLTMHQDKPIERFRKAVSEIPEVLECYNVSGEYDFLLKILARDMSEYERLIRERLSRINGISKIQSCFVLSTAKSTTILPV